MQYVVDSVGMQRLDETSPIGIDSWSPATVEPGVPFTINYIVRNTSVTQSWAVFGYILDETQTIMAGSVWDTGTYLVGPNQTLSAPGFNHPGVTGQIQRTIVVGHIAPGGTVRCWRCNPSSNELEFYDFPENTICGEGVAAGWQSVAPTCGGTGCTNPDGTEGSSACIGGYWATCTDGSWVYVSPPSPCEVQGCINPTGNEGDQACLNGYWNNCTDGAWVPTAYSCGGPVVPINWFLVAGVIASVLVVGGVFMVFSKKVK